MNRYLPFEKISVNDPRRFEQICAGRIECGCLFLKITSEAYSEPFQTSKMTLYVKIVNGSAHEPSSSLIFSFGARSLYIIQSWIQTHEQLLSRPQQNLGPQPSGSF